MERATGLAVLLISTRAIAADAMEPDDLPAPQLEVARDAAALDLPAVPAFELPAAGPGEHRPRELRVRGKRMLESVVKVSGHVTAIYDCEAELRRVDPAATRQQLRQAIDRDPTLCSQPKYKRPEDVTLDPSRLSLDAARDALRRAIRIGPRLWRAHYYLGRLYRDLEDAGRAAEQFTTAITGHASYRPAYIALSELYRRWGYLDQALAVATSGAARVRPTEVADLWFEIGLTCDAKHLDDKAIEAFGKVLDTRPRDVTSRFQRGQIYLRRGDFAGARPDLEEVVTSIDPQLAAAQPIAQQLLNQMAIQDRLASQPRPRPAGRTVQRLVTPRPASP